MVNGSKMVSGCRTGTKWNLLLDLNNHKSINANLNELEVFMRRILCYLRQSEKINMLHGSHIGHYWASFEHILFSEWLLFNANWAIFQLYHSENKLHFDEMMSIKCDGCTYTLCAHKKNEKIKTPKTFSNKQLIKKKI